MYMYNGMYPHCFTTVFKYWTDIMCSVETFGHTLSMRESSTNRKGNDTDIRKRLQNSIKTFKREVQVFSTSFLFLAKSNLWKLMSRSHVRLECTHEEAYTRKFVSRSSEKLLFMCMSRFRARSSASSLTHSSICSATFSQLQRFIFL